MPTAGWLRGTILASPRNCAVPPATTMFGGCSAAASTVGTTGTYSSPS